MFPKKRQINTLKLGEDVEDVFVVKIKKGIKEYSKGYSFELLLTDNSGKTVGYKFWGDMNRENVEKIYSSIKEDSVLLLKCRVSEFKGKLQLSANDLGAIRILGEGEYNPDDFIMPPKRDIEEMTRELQEKIKGIGNEPIRKLLSEIFSGELLERFKKHPGAISIHHSWKGGLLQHTLEVVEFCELSCDLFPDLDREMVIAGAILHDIGKLEEITTTTRIKGTRHGQLTGHIVIGYNIIAKKMDNLNTPIATREKILHIILSHHGNTEFGSPKEPMFPEALAVYYADELSSKLAEIIEFVKDSRESTEDEFMFHNKKGINLLLR